jgi:hypothetical protein
MKRFTHEDFNCAGGKFYRTEMIVNAVESFYREFERKHNDRSELEKSVEKFEQYFVCRLTVVPTKTLNQIIEQNNQLHDQLEMAKDVQDLTKQDEKNKTS